MTVMVAVPDSAEGRHALKAGIAEAQSQGSGLVIVNLTLGALDTTTIPDDLEYTIVERTGPEDRHPAETVIRALRENPAVSRLVICVARRSPVGKFVLGSVSQQMILQADVPVLAVKLPSA